MTAPVPVDEEAESTVAGCCIASQHGATLAHQRLVAGEFYDRTLARIFTASIAPEVSAAELGFAPHSQDAITARAIAIAGLVGRPVVWVEGLEQDRSVQWDTNGGFARRVSKGADDRRKMILARGVLEAIGRRDDLEADRLAYELGNQHLADVA